jgi:3-oxoacyl-[acyl-carrier protein] reductase
MSVLEGKRMVITGSSRGLGRAFAMASAAAGARVVVNGTDRNALAEVETTIREAGGQVLAVPGSVTEEAVCEALVSECVGRFGGIDVMVNNAGIVRDRTLMKMSLEEFDAVIAVHLRGAFACTRQAALAMREHGGHVIQVISASGLSGGFGQGNYAAAKAGMMGLLRTAVLEFSRFGIRTNALWPIAETDMTQVVFERARAAARERDAAPPEPVEMGFGKPEEVAQGLVWLASDGANHLNGQCMTFNGRKTALWTHPEERYVTFRERPWTVAELDEHYRGIEPLPIYRPKMVDDGAA